MGSDGEQLVLLRLQLAELGLELLQLGLQLAGALAQLLHLGVVGLAGSRRLLDLLGELVLLGADLVDPGVQLAAALVERQQLVELLGGAAPRQRGAGRLGVATDLLQVERGSASGGPALGLPGRGASSTSVPEYSLDEPGDRLGVLADDDVLGHDRPGEAAVADREDRVLVGLLALVEVRALGALAAVRGALGAGGLQRVAAGAALGEQLAALLDRSAESSPTSMPSVPQAASAIDGRGDGESVTRAPRTRRDHMREPR